MLSDPAPSLIDLRTDSHVHTSLCNHASGTMEEYVKAAIGKGLATIVFLEHLETGIQYFERTWLTEEDFARYFEEGTRLRHKYLDRISVLLGVEIGYNPAEVDHIAEKLTAFPWDRKGLSYHFFHHAGRHLNMVSRRPGNIEALAAVGVDRVVSAYLDGLTDAARIFDCHVLCHLDAVLRHYPGLRLTPSHLDQVDGLLDVVREKGMRLEVNTSGFSLRGEPFPGRDLLARAIDRGIGLTAASDAHRPDQVGRHFDRLPGYLSGLGQPVDPDPTDDVEPAA